MVMGAMALDPLADHFLPYGDELFALVTVQFTEITADVLYPVLTNFDKPARFG